MNLDARINALTVELRERGTIPCALLGRMARDTECCSRGLATTVEEFQTCRSCPEGQRLAATAPLWGFCKPLPAPVVYTPPAGANVREAAPVISEPRKTMPARLLDMRDIGIEAVGRQMRAERHSAKPVSAKVPRQAKPVATCRKCGCTDNRACLGGCWWVEPDLCSSCAEPKAPRQPKPKPEPKAPRPERQAKPVATCRQCGWIKHHRVSWPEPDLCGSCAPAAQPVRPKHLVKAAAKRTATPAPVQVPEAQLTPPVIDTRLVKLASALRELTADGRMRVSMLDLMHSIGAANYDEAAGLVIHAGLRTSRLYGPVQTVLVDHTARQFMASAASEVRQ